MNESNSHPVPAIRVTQLTKTYRKGRIEVTPLESVDLEVATGDFMALMGPSGSGKSTLLNVVAGIDRATTGQVEVGGENITNWSEKKLAKWRTRAIGYIFQQFNLMPVLTALENVELPLRLLPISRRKRHSLVKSALELVGLADRMDHYPRQLSGGQEQRVAIARAIATDPDIILADEPTGNLDRHSAEDVMNLIGELNSRFQKTVVLVTHDPEVATHAGRTIRVDKGSLVELEPVLEGATC